MAELKTKENDKSVANLLNSVENETKRKDALQLLEIFKEVTGLEPKMWGKSIVGFGKYHYKSERSKQEGDWPLTGFSPRKQNLTVYIMSGFDNHQDLVNKLGKCKTSVGCLYINKLSDVDERILKKLIKESVSHMKKIHSIR